MDFLQMKDRADYKKALIGNLKVLSHLFIFCYPTRPAAVLNKEMKAAHLEATITLNAFERWQDNRNVSKNLPFQNID